MPLSNIQPDRYDEQLAEKVARYKADFAAFALPEPQVFASAPLHYRMRAEFRVWHDGDRLDYAMFAAADPRTPIAIADFPVADPRIANVMPTLRDALCSADILRRRLFQVEFLATLAGDLLVTLIYHRELDAAWEAAARALADQLGIVILGRSRKQKVVLARDWVQESFELDGRTLSYRQIEGSFSQPNGSVNRRMLGWARQVVQQTGMGGDLLELYCGNGNFTIALAPLFGKVLATEVSKTSVYAAQHNLAANGVGNVALVRMASEEISGALAGEREYRRMDGIALSDYQFSTLFVDPPRAGLDDGTLQLAQRFDHILYISCNPETLRANVAALSDTHRIAAAAAFDQFPYTHHLEAGLLLVRR